MKCHLVLFIAAIIALPLAAIQAGANQPLFQNRAAANTVEGALSFDKETVRLKHAYAKLAEDDFERGKYYITLLFTDRPITENVVERRLDDKARNDQLKAFSIRIESLSRRVDSYTVYADKEYGGFTDGNKATLDFVIPDPKDRAEGKVNLHLENNQWKVGMMGLKDKSGKVTF